MLSKSFFSAYFANGAKMKKPAGVSALTGTSFVETGFRSGSLSDSAYTPYTNETAKGYTKSSENS